METSAIVLAAGAGTRMKSKRPKVMHELLGKPLIRWVVDAAHEAGIDDVIAVLGDGRKTVEPLVSTDCTIAVQHECRGTADAVNAARGVCEGKHGSILVLSGDCPLITAHTLADLVRAREDGDAAAVVLTMEVDDPFGYGRIVRDSSGQISCIVEQKDCTSEQARISECNSAFYCFDADFLFAALDCVSNRNAQGEFYLTDVIEIARKQGRSVIGRRATDADECLGVNTRVQLAQAGKVMQRRINIRHMLAGVTMLDPDTVWIGADATVGPDTVIMPNTMLIGATSIGSGSVIGPSTRLTDTVVGDGCIVDETVAIEAVIEDDCTCGPRAYLRPGAHLCMGAKVGTHVEIKKSVIGPGSKVPHLSYIGDTTMGADVNIGAGSITCNYDGQSKWPTTIGDHVFVGSDTMMVAPVDLGNNVTVGAGSVITDDVPDNALALGRARQVIKPNWKRGACND